MTWRGKGSARPAASRASGQARRAMAAGVSSRRANSITILAQGKPVGSVDPATGIFRKRCRASVHMLRKPVGWALDIQSLDAAERAGATLVQIEDLESDRMYTATIKSIYDNGILLNRGFGEQLLLPLDKWTVRDSQQLSLWGGA